MPAPSSGPGTATGDYTSLSKTQLYFSFSLVTSLFFLWGLSYGLLDVLNKHFLTVFGLTKTQSTLLQFAYFVSYLVVAPPWGIHIGLGLFSTGAVLFWPSAKFEKYGMFVAFTFVSASGLATLETAANSYITILGPPSHAAMRLTLAQAFNGIATVIGPQIAANTFFNGENQNNLGTVQYVYLALACFSALLNIGIAFAKLPEIKQVVSEDQEDRVAKQSIWKQYHTLFGAAAQFFYVGSQVAVASFTIFYITEQPGISPAYDSATASNMFSGCQAVFTFGRFLGVIYLRWIDPSFVLFINGIGLVIFSILTATIPGKGGIACLFMIFFFESVCYPVIFSIATQDLGPMVKIGSGIVALGVSGGAAYPSIQGAVSDAVSTWRSFFIPLTGFVPLLCYGGVMWVVNSRKYHGRLTIWTRKTNVNVKQNTGHYTPESDAKDDIEKVISLDEKPVQEFRERV